MRKTKKREPARLRDLKQGALFWYKKGKFEVKNKCHKTGIELKLLRGRFHYPHTGKKLPDTVSDHEKAKIILPRDTIVFVERVTTKSPSSKGKTGAVKKKRFSLKRKQ